MKRPRKIVTPSLTTVPALRGYRAAVIAASKEFGKSLTRERMAWALEGLAADFRREGAAKKRKAVRS